MDAVLQENTYNATCSIIHQEIKLFFTYFYINPIEVLLTLKVNNVGHCDWCLQTLLLGEAEIGRIKIQD
jgi:hypothetical protein